MLIELSTQSVKRYGGQITHSCIAFGLECVEDGANLASIPIDLALFGQPIPIGNDNRFDLFGNGFDAIKNVTDDLTGD